MVKIFGWFVWNNREINKKKTVVLRVWDRCCRTNDDDDDSEAKAAEEEDIQGHFLSTHCFPPSSYSCLEIHICWKVPWRKKIINLGQILKNPMRNWQHFYVQHFHANYSSWISTSIKNADTWWIGKVTIILLTIFIFLSFCQISLSMNGIIRKLTRGATGGIVLLLHFSLHPLDVSI